MKQALTTYTMTAKNYPSVMQFKYDLNGLLKTFKVLEGELNEEQRAFLFSRRFPYNESKIQKWQKLDNVELVIGSPDLSFEVFYDQYKYKVGKLKAQRAWDKLSKADRISCLKSLKAYDDYLFRKKIAKAYPATYINQRKFEDEFSSIR